jgi:hypothetical protein
MRTDVQERNQQEGFGRRLVVRSQNLGLNSGSGWTATEIRAEE